MDAWKSDLVKVVSYLGVLPLGSEPSQEQIKKRSLPSFGQAVLALPKSATEGANVQREESTHTLKADSNVGDGSPFILSKALPVVTPKLVKRIIKGEYVDMAELLNDNMEAEWRRALMESEISPYVSQHRPGCRKVPDILSWLHRFSLYAAVVCCSHPTKAKQLWAYQAMMINEARRCGGRGWLLYDAAFCQQISSLEAVDFSKINQSLYSTTILAYENRRQCCPNCMLPDYSLEECSLYMGKPSPAAIWSGFPARGREDRHSRSGESSKKCNRKGACYTWNDGRCTTYPCPYEYVCSKCFGDHKRSTCGSGSKPLKVKVKDKGHGREH